jgi:nicotinamide mononucleotide transporter
MNSLEWCGAILAVIYLALAEKRLKSCWIPYVGSSAVYLVVFWNASLPVNAFLQLFFVAMGVRGYLSWSKSDKPVVPLRCPPKLLLTSAVGVVASTLVLTGLLSRSGTPIGSALGDSFLTAASLAATVLTERRYLESWVAWIVIDLLAVAFFFVQGLPLTSVLYLLYVLLAFRCFREWQRVLGHHKSDVLHAGSPV